MESPRKASFPLVVTLSVVFATTFGGVSAYLAYLVLREVPLSIRSEQFPSVDGEVVRSEIEVVHGDEGSSEEARIEVRYRVGRRDYTTSTIRFSSAWSAFDEPASLRVERMPVGRRVAVFYEPARPSVACLEPGIVWTDIAGLVFLLPFLLVAVFAAASPFVYRDEDEPEVRDTDDGRIARFHVDRSHWALSLLGGSILACFVACGCGTCVAPMTARGASFATFVWLVAIATIVLFTARQAENRRNGRYDVLFDREGRSLRLPPQSITREPRIIPIADIASIAVEPWKDTDSETEHAMLVLAMKDGKRDEARLAITHGAGLLLVERIRAKTSIPSPAEG